MANVQITIRPEDQLPLLKELATNLYRVDAFECIGKKRCDCYDCQPLTLEEACIQFLAGQDVDFRFVNA
jgi:hypothetical protein